MNSSTDKVIDRLESAERMLRNARLEHGRGNAEDAVTFIEVAGARLKSAIKAIQSARKAEQPAEPHPLPTLPDAPPVRVVKDRPFSRRFA